MIPCEFVLSRFSFFFFFFFFFLAYLLTLTVLSSRVWCDHLGCHFCLILVFGMHDDLPVFT
ncbi:uncharacterized protein BO66DRAFT_16372 [Aspergillus aculeatinus CBS 121060]|uniref:Uncharacterized protein n=1 Tax=Aspergillus aculeatinus CBS 121060 TaxID=1448322 RepID=A0ACD1HGW5_9EURO|nr:hypothetical protein BO66DRAFT_16372 [Aspergillus aculeatinus CBS 121060]RAH72693.1 hypothetical protein BO66DRAFT_16372 [Aspergillus aculeatinus CBS 121060]